MKLIIIVLLLAGLATGCETKSQARAEAQKAYLAGQNDAMRHALAQQQAVNSITVVGPVQVPNVPWVAGLTLTQAIATANYLPQREPRQIILTRQGQDQIIAPEDLVNGVQIILQPGDKITIKEE
jgi:hypothetical protein